MENSKINFDVRAEHVWNGSMTEKSLEFCRMFGLLYDMTDKRVVLHKCKFFVDDGVIVLLQGPSGSGKSTLLREIERSVSPSLRINLDEFDLPDDRNVINSIEGTLLETTRLLSVSGLNDVWCLLNKPANLSEGEKFRFRLAKALATGKKFVFADEFCSGLDQITSLVISSRLRTFASRTGRVIFLASSREDIVVDLEPDVLITCETGTERAGVTYKLQERQSLHDREIRKAS